LDDLEAHAAAVERIVPGDLRPTEHEPDAPVGQVEADRHLRVALVGAIAETHEPAELLTAVVEVEVRALVVVRLARVRVEEVVAVETDQTCGRHHRLLRRGTVALRVARPATSMLRTDPTRMKRNERVWMAQGDAWQAEGRRRAARGGGAAELP